MTKSVQDDLTRLGLGSNEAKVYLALIGKDKKRAGELIKDTDLHRNLVYQALEALVDKRLISKTLSAGVAQFQANDPDHFRDDIRERELITERVIDELKERRKLSEQEITIYEGDDAIRTFSLKNAARLERGESIYVLGTGGPRFEAAMGQSALTKYFSEIAKRGSLRVLMYKRQSYTSATYAWLQKQHFVEIRTLPFETSPSSYIVFTNYSVAFHIYEMPYTIIEIKNAHLVAAYKNYFELLWNQNVRIEQGMDALREAFIEMIDELKPGEEYFVLGGNLGPEYQRMSAFFDDIHRYRISRGVVANILAQNESAKNIRERNRRVGDPTEHISHTKIFHTPFLAPMQINMVNGRAYMVLYKKDAPTIIYFEDKVVHDGFKLYFDEIWNRQTETLNGHEGIIELCERVLEEGKDYHLIAANGAIIESHPEYYPEFTRRRVEKKIRLHILANDAVRNGPMSKLPLVNIAYLPQGFAGPMVIWIFGNTVAHVLWHQPETIFLIQDEKTADSYRNYYEALKRLAKE